MVSGILLGLALHIILARDVLKSPLSDLRVAVGNPPGSVTIADFNGDGKLVTDSWAEDRLELLFGDGKGSFTTPGTYVAVGKHPYQRIRVADLKGDGKADI